jgi:hypothetical protein
MSVTERPKATALVTIPAPVPSSRQYSFTGGQVGNPAAPPPGDRLDAEFDRLRAAISAVIDWVEASLAQPVLRDSGDDNAASDAEGAAALAYRYAILAQAWAEYMPGTIPPNILAVMDITGDHWSSRWWAHQAAIGGDPTPPVVESTPPQTLGRNLLHNPLFNIAQRGLGPFTVSGYTADRWGIQMTLDTANFQPQPLSDANRVDIGDEAATTFMAGTVTGNAAAGASTVLYQAIEGVRRLSGKTVTVSFWADASAGMKLGVSLNQNFGSGGSPSSTVNGAGQSVTLTPFFALHSFTFTMPSVSGKILGTNSDDNTELLFWYSSGATNASHAGNIGVQSGTINIWGVQLEIGSVATPLEKPDPRYDLANCQRFYQAGVLELQGYQIAGDTIAMSNLMPVPMRAVPAVVPVITTSINVTSPNIVSVGSSVISIVGTATTSAGFVLQGNYTASADL